MVMTVGISALIGVALGQRFNVLILIPTLILAMVSTAIIEVMRGAGVWSMALTIVVVATVLQIVYLVGSIAHGVVENLAPLTRKIQKHMEVVGSDGKHVGTIDHTESEDRIVLTSDESKSRGKPHLISVDWIDYVAAKFILISHRKRQFRNYGLQLDLCISRSCASFSLLMRYLRSVAWSSFGICHLPSTRTDVEAPSFSDGAHDA
jgi:hypothetical protein